MKRTFQPHLVLTLFMLVVVMAAAFFFLFHSWRVVANEAAAAETFEAAAATAVVERDTAVTRQAALDADLVDSQQQIDQLQADLDTAQRTIEQFTTDTGDEDTRVIIANPPADQPLTAGTAVDIIVLAIDPAGIDSIEFNTAGEPVRVRTGGTTVLERYPWTPATPGPARIEVTATNSNGRMQTVFREVNVAPAPSTPQEDAPAEAEATAVMAAATATNGPFVIDEPVELIIFATDQAGITEITVTMADEEVDSFVADGETIVVNRAVWTPTATGEFTLTIELENINGDTAVWEELTLVVEE